MDIRLVAREDIDKVKWNSCVHYANNGNVFGYMWYLNHAAGDWDALVEGDYESVFPLVWRERRFLGRELYQPALMRELGVYSIHVLSPKRIRAFLEAIPEDYRTVDIVLNEQNALIEDAGFRVETHTNYQLPLFETYETLPSGYSTDLHDRLKAAEHAGLMPHSNLKPETIADFYLRHAPPHRKKQHTYYALQRIMYNVLHRGWGFPSGIQNAKGELLAVNFFIYSHKKVISLVPVESPEGKKVGALPFLMDMLIRTHAGRPLLLDFNTSGADELAIAFGAHPNQYYRMQRGRHPWWAFAR